MTADTYYLRQGNSQSGLQLTYGGAAVTMGMFGAWTPIGVEQTASGYQVAWRGASGSDQYQLWDVNSSGAFRSNYAGVMASSNWIMRTVETTLRQDLNNDGLTGLPTSPYDIAISYSGDPGYQIFFDAAAARWEQVITADVPDVINPGYGYIDDLLISATVTLIDGVGGSSARRGPTTSGRRRACPRTATCSSIRPTWPAWRPTARCTPSSCTKSATSWEWDRCGRTWA
jgi:hypothetical protein